MFNFLKEKDMLKTWDNIIGITALFYIVGGVIVEIKLVQLFNLPFSGVLVTSLGGFVLYLAITYGLTKWLHRKKV